MTTKIIMPPRKGWLDPCGEWVGDGYDAEWNAALDEVLRLNATPPQPAEVGELVEAVRGMLALDEENHQRCSGDEDVCLEVRKARAALAKLEGKA